MAQDHDTQELLELEALPRDSYELIDLLNKALPPRCITLGETLEAAHRYAGARELVDSLVSMKTEELALARDKELSDPTDEMPRILRRDGEVFIGRG